MNNDNSQLLPSSQNDDQNDPQTVSPDMTPGHPMPSSTSFIIGPIAFLHSSAVETYPPMPVQFGTSDSDGIAFTFAHCTSLMRPPKGSLGHFLTCGMRFNFNRTTPQVGGGGQSAQTSQSNGSPVSSPFKPLSEL
jgi:hypothetical protein